MIPRWDPISSRLPLTTTLLISKRDVSITVQKIVNKGGKREGSHAGCPLSLSLLLLLLLLLWLIAAGRRVLELFFDLGAGVFVVPLCC